jgi:uncharacterized damage-inducible protein DinB
MRSRALIELLHGKGAHADPVACVEDVSVELAARQVDGFLHSIGQLVFHMNYWMEYDLRRIRGERPPYPQHNSESFPATPFLRDAEEWDRLKKQFAAWIAYFASMAELPRVELDRQIESTQPGHTEIARTLEALLWQLAVHNSYHTGQIAMIRRVLGAWPPRGGGDTW